MEKDDGANIMEEEYITNDDKDIRHPIVIFALRVFHSLEVLNHEHSKNVGNHKEKNNLDKKVTKTEVKNIRNVDTHNMNGEQPQEIQTKFIIS